MDVLIDGQAMQTPGSRNRGIGRYSRNLIAALARVRPDWRLTLVVNAHLPPIDDPRLAGLPTATFTPPVPRTRFDPNDSALNEHYYGDWLAARRPDAVLVTSFFEDDAVVPRFVGPKPLLVGVLHDLIPLLFAGSYLNYPPLFAQYGQRLRQFLQADRVVCNSEATARDFRRHFPAHADRAFNIAGAADPTFAPLPPARLAEVRAGLAARVGLDREFIFYVGAWDFRKNLFGAMRAFAELPAEARRSLDLVITCQLLPEWKAELERLADGLGIAGSVKLTGFIDDEELKALYQSCRLFFFPSVYEGLGLPVLEAMACGAPVVASNSSSIPEYAGDVCWLADPAAPGALGEALRRALGEPHAARLAERQAFARGFTWEQSAERTCAAMQAHVPGRPPGKPRLAWVGPQLPSGPDAELVDRLLEAYEIELVLPPGPDAEPALRHHPCLVLTGDEVAARHAACPYDLFVFHPRAAGRQPFIEGLMARHAGLTVIDAPPAAGRTANQPSLLDLSAALLVDRRRFDGEVTCGVRLPVGVVPPAADAAEAEAAYREAIERAIRWRNATDALWRETAVNALADSTFAGDAAQLIAGWASLRARGRDDDGGTVLPMPPPVRARAG